MLPKAKHLGKYANFTTKRTDKSGADKQLTYTRTKGDKVVFIVNGMAGLSFRKQRVFSHQSLPFHSFTLSCQNYQKQTLLSVLCGCSRSRVLQEDNISILL